MKPFRNKSAIALEGCGLCLPCLPYLPGTRRAQPLAELSPSERSEDSAVNRALRARIRRKLEAVKQEAIQLPRLNCLGRRESVLSTYGFFIISQKLGAFPLAEGGGAKHSPPDDHPINDYQKS